MEFDSVNRQILALLQKDSRMPQRDISEHVNLSASAVNRRIAAMEDEGIIQGHVAVVYPAKVGKPITIIVAVSLEKERLDLLDAARRRFVACPAVQQVYYVTSEANFVLVLSFREAKITSFRTMWPSTAARYRWRSTSGEPQRPGLNGRNHPSEVRSAGTSSHRHQRHNAVWSAVRRRLR